MSEEKDKYRVNLGEFWGKLEKRHLFILLLIFLLGFGIRGHLMKWDLFFGFDSYFHARMVSYIIQDGVVPANDPLAYYQLGGGPIGAIAPVFWYLTAGIYKVFTLGAGYDKATWIFFVKLLPAVFGGLIGVAMYFFVKELYGRKVGYIAGFFSAVVPSFVYRTMSGFFEEDSLGFLWLIIGLYFFAKAIKPMEFNKQTIKNALIAAVFFGIMAWTWEMFLLIPMVLVAYFIATMLILWFKAVEKSKLLAMAKVFVICFVLFWVLATLKDQGLWIHRSTEYITNYIPISPENIDRAQSRGPGVLAQTVGEENTGNQFFMLKYNALIVFPFAALFLIPYRMLRKKQDNLSMLIFFYVLITLFMAWSKLKFTYTFGLPVAASAAFVAAEIIDFLKGRAMFERKVAVMAFAFMMLVGVGAATHFVTERSPTIEILHGWKGALKWIKEETPEDAKFFNWWDEGHWITFVGERAVIEDNRNLSFAADSNFARFVIEEDEDEAYRIVKEYEADYVIFGDDILGKLGSMGLYAFNTWDTSDMRLQKFAGYAGYAVAGACHRESDSFTGQSFIVCGQARFNEAGFNAIPTTYTKQTTNLLTSTVPLFIYREADNSRIYQVSGVVNNTMAARLWFNDPTLKHFREVYGKDGVKVFKVLE